MESTPANDTKELKYKIIRQPYRITMARWNYTVIQKRILTKIIAKLQREMTSLERGIHIGQLDLFKTNNDSVELGFLLNDLVKNSNNYAVVKEALKKLRNIDIEIVLPAVKEKKNKPRDEEIVLTGLIERAVIRKHERTVKITMHKATALELIKVSHGLTYFAEEVMYLSNNSYTQKIYEIICHWKSKDVYSIAVDEFRKLVAIEDKYPETKLLIRDIIKPAQKELLEIGDVYFVFTATKKGNTITAFNFIIKTRFKDAEENSKHILLREDAINILKKGLHFNELQTKEIWKLVSNLETIVKVHGKITSLWVKLFNKEKVVENIPAWVIASLKNEFPEQF
ncbi:replication initiation protein [Ferruginibacter sp.]